MEITEVIKRPVVTEKSHRLISEQNAYTLAVDKKANKKLVKRAVEKLFGVKVLAIKIVSLPAKVRRTGKWRRPTKLPGLKKAIVKLPEDQKIPLFELEKETKTKK